MSSKRRSQSYDITMCDVLRYHDVESEMNRRMTGWTKEESKYVDEGKCEERKCERKKSRGRFSDETKSV